jgi:hypothetical protein
VEAARTPVPVRAAVEAARTPEPAGAAAMPPAPATLARDGVRAPVAVPEESPAATRLDPCAVSEAVPLSGQQAPHHHLLPWMVPVRRPKLSEVVVVLPFVTDRPVLRPIAS